MLTLQKIAYGVGISIAVSVFVLFLYSFLPHLLQNDQWENIDGIQFVQRISAQHGSAMPELTDVEEFITLSLKLTDGSERIIYAGKIDGGKIDGEPSIPLNEIRSFLNK